MSRILLSYVADAAAVLASAQGAAAQTEIQWRHAMGGALGEAVNQMVDQFNKSQAEYKVNAVFKGSYPETLTAAIAAFRAKQGPDIVQVFEVGTATMMAAKGAVYPVHQLMADEKEPFDPKAFLGAGLLLEQGDVQEGGPRSRDSAQDLEGRRRLRRQARRLGRQVRLHLGV